MGRLLLLFTVIPAVELYFLIKVGNIIGAMNTILLIIATGVVGAYYARQQGFEVLMRIQTSMSEGKVPALEMIDGALLLVGGAFLVTPGLITDVAGFSLIFPLSRGFIKGWVINIVRNRVSNKDFIIDQH
jgi:UPF0716 protein FxsA